MTTPDEPRRKPETPPAAKDVCIDANPGPGKPHESFVSTEATPEELERAAKTIDEAPTG